MDLVLLRALLALAKYCASCDDCVHCEIREFCGKMPLEW